MWRVLRAQSDFSNTTLRNQLTSLVLYEAITTGRLNGKSLVSFADRFFHRVKANDLLARKYAHSVLLDKNAVKKVFEDILPRYELSATNYVRSLSVAPRRGDNAKQLAVMLIKEAGIEPTFAPSKLRQGKPDSAPSELRQGKPASARAMVGKPVKTVRINKTKAVVAKKAK